VANSKISALTSATTVTGTEVLPIVQSSATVKLAISDLTPGFANTFGFKNRLMNGSMESALYGTSGTVANSTAVPTSSTGYITVDRWFMYATGAALTATQQKIMSTGIPYQTLITGAASNTVFGIGQRIEDVNSCDLAGKTCNLSVYLQGNGVTTVTWTAYYANTSNTFGTIATPTKTSIATGTFTINGTLTRYNAQVSVPAAAYTGIEILFTVAGITAGNNFVITGVQFELGSKTTSYDFRSLQQEYPLVMRYRENGSYRWRGVDGGATDVVTNSFKVYKYATPTVSVGTANIYQDAFAIALTGVPYDTGTVSWYATSEIA
jgi:hypothetical protein